VKQSVPVRNARAWIIRRFQLPPAVPLSAVFMGIAMAFPHARDRNWQDNLFSPVLFGVLSMA
jgi:hypothetical protein